MTKTIRTIAAAVCACCLALAVSACAPAAQEQSETSAPAEQAAETTATASTPAAGPTAEATGPYATGIHHATVQVEGYPEFTIELDADAAPVSTSNFCNLAEKGYYDGLAFYRIADGFCLQGGTLGNGASGSDPSLTPIVGEFSVNGIDNKLADDFQRGTVAMARTMDPDSATSTFFVTLASNPQVSMSLDGQYAAFGTIDDAGMETVDAIVADYLEFATGDMGVIDDEANMPIIKSIKVVD